MISLERKTNRLNPIIEERQAIFDAENQKLASIRNEKATTVSKMRQKQTEYMNGVDRLNNERGSANRLMLEALERGLDSTKQEWMNLYNQVIEIEKKEKLQLIALSESHKSLEAIKHLQAKYQMELIKYQKQRDLKQIDEIALRKFTHG